MFGPRVWWRWPKQPKPTPIVTSPTKSSNPKLSYFINRNYNACRIFIEFEQLSSSLVWRVMAEQILSKLGKSRYKKCWIIEFIKNLSLILPVHMQFLNSSFRRWYQIIFISTCVPHLVPQYFSKIAMSVSSNLYVLNICDLAFKRDAAFIVWFAFCTVSALEYNSLFLDLLSSYC